MKKVTVIKKIKSAYCGKCNITANGSTGKRRGCSSCNGTGEYKDYYYIITVGNIAFGMDTLK